MGFGATDWYRCADVSVDCCLVGTNHIVDS